MKKLFFAGIFFGAFAAFCVSPAFAVLFTFSDIPDTDDPAINIASNFSGDVSDAGTGQVRFTISSGSTTSFIGKIYWEDDNTLLSSPVYDENNDVDVETLGGVNFVFDLQHINNPPQGNAINFDSDFEAIADKTGSGKQGVDAGETAAFLFSGDFADVLTAMTSGALRVAIHVQGINLVNPVTDGSDSYVSSPIPEPATMLLLGAGLIGCAIVGRKRFFKK